MGLIGPVRLYYETHGQDAAERILMRYSLMNTVKYTTLMAALVAGLTLGGGETMAQTVNEAPTSLTETYGDWVVRCVSPAAAEGQPAPARVCEMTQELQQQRTGQRVLALSVQKAESGGRLTVVAPFGLLLAEGVKLSVGETPLVALGFTTCLPAGCIAVSDLEVATMNALAAGDQVVVEMTDTNAQPLKLNVSLRGFTAAWNKLTSL
jgi:invasion protein IalB